MCFETICVTKIEDGENEYSDNIKNLNRLIQDIQKSIITVNERINNYNVFKNNMFDKVIKYANKLKEFDIDKLKEVNKRRLISKKYNINQGFIFKELYLMRLIQLKYLIVNRVIQKNVVCNIIN